MLSTLYNVEINTINYHIKKIYNDSELTEYSIIRKFRIVQKEGNREVARDVAHYNLQMIIALGFKIDNERAIQFRKLANEIVKEYTIKGFAMDDERLVEVNKLSKRNNNAVANMQDYKLSRYICYLLVQNADPSKDTVALGQTYFAI